MSYSWCAIYSTGEHFAQYDQEGNKRSTESIDRKLLRTFIIFGNDGQKRIFTADLAGGDRFFYRRRTRHTQGTDSHCHIIGLPHLVVFLFEDGTTVVKPDFVTGHTWFDHIEPVPSDSISIGNIE